MNVNTFSPSFMWICLNAVSAFVSCSLVLWDWSAFSRPAVTLHLSHMQLSFVNPVTVSKSHRQLLLSFLWIQFMALCCISWNMETQAGPNISAVVSALPSPSLVTLPYWYAWALQPYSWAPFLGKFMWHSCATAAHRRPFSNAVLYVRLYFTISRCISLCT